MNIASRLFLAILPLLLTFVCGWLVMEGHLNLGGGEKDIFLIVPLLLWSMLYLCCYVVYWWRGATLRRSIARSAGVATGLLVIAGIVLTGVSALRSH